MIRLLNLQRGDMEYLGSGVIDAGRNLAMAQAGQDVMELRARVFSIALGVVVLLFVVNLVRTKKLKEEFALLWLLTAVVLVLAPLFIDYLDMIAHGLGIEYPPALIFVLAIISVLLILFQFSMRLSHYGDQIKALTQELALLRAQLEFLERAQGSKKESDDNCNNRTSNN